MSLIVVLSFSTMLQLKNKTLFEVETRDYGRTRIKDILSLITEVGK